jgi:curved DNA-binding protein CbpA
MEQRGIAAADGKPALTPDEIGLLASLIVDEPDHYTALGVDRNASSDDIGAAYRLAVEFFHPLKCRALTESDRVMQWKLSSAWVRLEKAFSVLSNESRRLVYDGNLNGKPFATQLHPDTSSAIIESEKLQHLPAQQYQPHDTSNAVAGTRTFPNGRNKRRVERARLSLPVRVTFEDSWQELTRTLDVSPLGMRFNLSHRIEPGSRLQLELPMPTYLRTHNYDDELYVAAGYVIYVIQDSGGRQVVAEFT